MNNGWGLNVSAQNPAIEQGGGQVQADLELSQNDQVIVNNISNLAWSGDGIQQGANINYELMLRDPSGINSADGNVLVTYTISAD